MKKIFKSILIYLKLLSFSRQIFILLLQLINYPKWIILKKSKKIFLEIGSGNKKGINGYVTVDLLSGADIVHDLRKGIPLPENSVDRIYASHVLEHIPFKELIILLNEIYRVLKKEGELSVSVPDASLFIKAYINKERFQPKDGFYGPAVVDTGSLIDQLNYITYMNQEHKYLFDKENLINTLKKIPFSSVDLRNFDKNLDSKARDSESIYAIAIK
tara:strand:+ start:139 stop:786 length:648 start_codon:yes stop_codon:yes gene_type:complete